jgi:hypothetical protein
MAGNEFDFRAGPQPSTRSTLASANPTRRFQIGDTVTFGLGKQRNASPGPYQVVACLLREDSSTEYAYRIKSPAEPNERVAVESQLTPFN